MSERNKMSCSFGEGTADTCGPFEHTWFRAYAYRLAQRGPSASVLDADGAENTICLAATDVSFKARSENGSE